MSVYDAYWLESLTINGENKKRKLLKTRRASMLQGKITNGGNTEINLYWLDPDSNDDNPTVINKSSGVLGTSKVLEQPLYSPWFIVEIKNTDSNTHEFDVSLQAV